MTLTVLEGGGAERTTRERWLAALVLVLSAYLIFAGLGTRSLENKDITRTAEIARETLESGRWLAPTREGEIETEKPPLYVWLVAGLGKVTGHVGAIESRLPAAIGSFLTVLFVFAWLARLRGPLVASVAAAFLACGQVFLELARLSRVDSFFAFLLAVSVVLAYEAEKRGRRSMGKSSSPGEGSLAQNLLYSALSGVALAGAMLTKSPLLALVLHLASIGGFYIVDLAREKPWQALREPAPLTILRRFLAPPASVPPILACALFALWFVPFKSSLTPAEWDAVWHQFKFENTDRGVTGSDKPQPFWFYVPGVLLRAAPGSLFALALVRHEDTEERSVHRFAQCWWFFPFLVLSIASGKQGRYIVPCLPGLAVAGALNWRAVASSDSPLARTVERGLAWLVFGLAAFATVALPVGAALRLPEVLGDACWLAVLCAVTAVLAYRAASENAPTAATPLAPSGAIVPLLLAFFVIETTFNVVILPAPSIEGPRVVIKHLADALPADPKLELVLFQIPKQGPKGETRQRRTRILLSIYRDQPVPPVATTPEQLLQELAASDRRRALVDSANWEGLASITSELVVEQEIPLRTERGEDRYRLVRRAR